MTDTSDLLDVVNATTTALHRHGIEYFVTGSFAVGGSFNLIHLTTYLKVDVFPCVTAFNREAIRRAVKISLPGTREPLRVASLEDIILSKLWWYRLGGETSETQQRDVRRLIELNRARLDVAYLEPWATELKVSDLLSRFLS